MKITKIEIIRNKRPVPLPAPWRPAWDEPDTRTQTNTGFAFYKVHTDEGIVGLGPCTGGLSPLVEDTLLGQDPAYIQRLF